MDRTFLAVDLDGKFLAEVVAVVSRLRDAPLLSAARWAKRDTLHVTLRFFGDTNDPQREALASLAGELARRSSPLFVRAPSLHGFPAPQRAHVLVLDIADDAVDADAVDASAGLASLAARAETAAVTLGFSPETRPYHPHLTLARMRRATNIAALADNVAASLPVGLATAVTLYASRRGPTGSIYTPLASAALPVPAP